MLVLCITTTPNYHKQNQYFLSSPRKCISRNFNQCAWSVHCYYFWLPYIVCAVAWIGLLVVVAPWVVRKNDVKACSCACLFSSELLISLLPVSCPIPQSKIVLASLLNVMTDPLQQKLTFIHSKGIFAPPDLCPEMLHWTCTQEIKTIVLQFTTKIAPCTRK